MVERPVYTHISLQGQQISDVLEVNITILGKSAGKCVDYTAFSQIITSKNVYISDISIKLAKEH